MNKFLPTRVMGVLGIAVSSLAFAQNYQTMPIASGLNEDVIANGTGPAISSTSAILDGDSFAFVARDFLATATSTPITYGVPTNGIINSVVTSTPGLSYQLANLSAPNSLKLSNANVTGTVTFATPKQVSKLYMLSTSGSAPSTLTVTVNFSDGTNQQATGISIADWYNGSNFAIQGLGRINRTNNDLEPAGGTNPRMYQSVINIDAANHTKFIESVTITKTSTTTNGYPNIFAFSADAYSDCAPPTLNAVGTLTSNSAAVSWTPATGSTATSYDVYYSTTNTIPTSSTTPSQTGITGNSTLIPGLAPTTTYYYWVRANCNTATGQSAWSFSGNFTTLCGALIPPYTNTFTPFPGGCWALNLIGGDSTSGPTGTGSALWVVDGYLNNGSTGAARINLYTTNRRGWMKTVPFDLSGGGYRVKFDYGVTAFTGTASIAMGTDDYVQFLVSNDGGSTWTVLQTWNNTNAPSNTLNTYSYDLTGYNSANTVFAVFGTDGTVDDPQDYNFYVDNFIVEAAQLATAETSLAKKEIKVSPNPFTDVINISEFKDIKTLKVTDLSGRTLKTIENPEAQINLGDLSGGLYILNLQFKDGSQKSVKVIKK